MDLSRVNHDRPGWLTVPSCRRVLCLLLLTCLALAGNGCGFGPTFQQVAPLPDGPVCRIALLPLVNESRYTAGDLLVYRMLVAELVRSGNFEVVQEQDIRHMYQQMQIYPNQLPNLEQTIVMGERLGNQIFIDGRINEMVDSRGKRAPTPRLSLTLRVLDGRTGRILWTTYHTREGEEYRKVMHFGLENSMTGLARHVTREILTLWNKKGLKPCSE